MVSIHSPCGSLLTGYLPASPTWFTGSKSSPWFALVVAACPEALRSGSITFLSSLLQPHVPVLLPLAHFTSPVSRANLCRLDHLRLVIRTFPTLSLRIFPWMPGPLPRRVWRCTYPFLPASQRPSLRYDQVGFPNHYPCGNFSTELNFGAADIS